MSNVYDQLPSTLQPVRTGDNTIERAAVAVVRREIAAMPASLVVQLALWPDEVARWAREIGSSESLVYNMLAARKPYARTRALLADRLDVSLGVVDHLIEAHRANPTSRRSPDEAPAPRPPIDWTTAPYARYRDGTNPIERRALRVMANDVASMPASSVVGLAMWPESLTAWSRDMRFKSSVVWATLSGSPSAPVRDALARRLGTSLRDLDALVRDARATPTSRRVPRLSARRDDDASRVTTADAGRPDGRVVERVERVPDAARDSAHVDDRQLGLGL